MKKYVLMDFDGTITRRDTTRSLLLSLLFARPRLCLRLASGIWRMLNSRTVADLQAAKDDAVGRMLAGLDDRGLRNALANYSRLVAPLLRPSMLETIREKCAGGFDVLIVTASAELAVEHVFSDWTVTVVGTRFVRVDGVFTGAISGVPCYGENKPACIQQAVGSDFHVGAVAEGWSDSLSDWAMMQLAEQRFWFADEKARHSIREVDQKAVFVSMD